MSAPNVGPYGTAPPDNPDYVWVQVDPSLNRDDVLQWFVNIQTGYRVWGKTSGTFSDHIHLYTYPQNVDSNQNLDPVTSQVSKNGSLVSFFVALGTGIAGIFFPPADAAIPGIVGGGVSVVLTGTPQTPQGYTVTPPASSSSGSAGSSGVTAILQSPLAIVALVLAAFVLLEGDR